MSKRTSGGISSSFVIVKREMNLEKVSEDPTVTLQRDKVDLTFELL
jgi:hypothetical protein